MLMACTCCHCYFHAACTCTAAANFACFTAQGHLIQVLSAAAAAAALSDQQLDLAVLGPREPLLLGCVAPPPKQCYSRVSSSTAAERNIEQYGRQSIVADNLFEDCVVCSTMLLRSIRAFCCSLKNVTDYVVRSSRLPQVEVSQFCPRHM